MARRKEKRKKKSVPSDIREAFHRLGLNRPEVRDSFLRLRPVHPQPTYQVVTWISGHSDPIGQGEKRHA